MMDKTAVIAAKTAAVLLDILEFGGRGIDVGTS